MLLEGKVEWERLLRGNLLSESKCVFVCFICCGLGKGPRFGFGWNGGAPGRHCEESPTGGLPGTRPLPRHQGYPVLCHSQGPVPPVPQAWLLLGALPLSSALSSSAHSGPMASGLQCQLQEEATVLAPSHPRSGSLRGYHHRCED